MLDKIDNAGGSPLVTRDRHKFTPPAKNSAGESDWVLLLDAAP